MSLPYVQRWLGAAVLVAATLTSSAPSSAQAEGFAINRFDPADRGSDWFAADSLDLRGDQRWAFGGVIDWAHKPLVAYDSNGEETGAIVGDQLHLHLGGALVLWDRLRFGVNLPVLAFAQSEGAQFGGGTVAAAEGAGIGDLRLGGDVRLVGEYEDPATLGFGLAVHLPTGSRDAFTSDGRVRVVPRVTLAGRVTDFVYSVRTGINVRTQGQDFAGEPFGTEWQFGAAAGMRLFDDDLVVGPELYGSTVIADGSDGFFDREGTPLEAIVGGHYRLGSGWRLGLGAGPGLNRGLGSPTVRVLASLEWVQDAEPEAEPPPPDLDGDGILDRDDACVAKPGPANTDPAKHGCPKEKPKDTDGDGILDRDDACPKEPGEANDDPEEHGCPRRDRDGDGIFDDEDACVELKGVSSDDPNLHGCPLFDSDGDGILDRDDACPDQKGKANEDPKKHGCPKAKIVGKTVQIMERIEFDTGKATIRPESTEVLQAVLDVLTGHPELKKLSVEGHTDNRGARGYNVNLSRKRAAAVRTWLVEHGIEASRLSSQGYGPDKPIDDNDTDEGRQNNRRVEFHITQSETTGGDSDE